MCMLQCGMCYGMVCELQYCVYVTVWHVLQYGVCVLQYGVYVTV